MKLLLCRACHDIVAIHRAEPRHCRCGKSCGQYRPDGNHADVWGPHAVMLGLSNRDFPRLAAGEDAEEGFYPTVDIYTQPPWHPRAHYHERCYGV